MPVTQKSIPEPANSPRSVRGDAVSVPVSHQKRVIAARMPVTQNVLSILQARIVSGEWPTGFRLESQRELADQLGVSRASLREAISSLEAFGLVSVEPGRGVFVKTPEAAVTDVIGTHSNEELYEARYLMEGWAAALAALSITDAQLAELGALVDDMGRALALQDHAALDRLDFAFHACIAAACQNRLLRKALAPIFSEHDMSSAPIADMAFISTRVREHREIYAAMAAHDPKQAQAAMRRHVLRSAKRAQVALSPGIAQMTA